MMLLKYINKNNLYTCVNDVLNNEFKIFKSIF